MARAPKIIDELKRVGVRPVRERGQNFLHDGSVLEAIVRAGSPKATDKIVEIGAGLGALTRLLVEFPDLTVIEIEKRFANEIRMRYPKVKVIEQDVLQVNFGEIGSDLVVFGNLPYSLSTDILFHLIAQREFVRRAIFLLQKEFVDRMAAPPGGSDYGALSVACQIYADVEAGLVVGGECFHPKTKVESRVVTLEFLKTPRVNVGDPKFFEKVVRAAFGQRRKKLVNSLERSPYFVGVDMKSVLEKVGIDPGRRAQTLSMEEFATLAAALAHNA